MLLGDSSCPGVIVVENTIPQRHQNSKVHEKIA